MALAKRLWVLDQGPTIALWGARRPDHLDPIDEVDGWHIDEASKRDIDTLLERCVKDPVCRRNSWRRLCPGPGSNRPQQARRLTCSPAQGGVAIFYILCSLLILLDRAAFSCEATLGGCAGTTLHSLSKPGGVQRACLAIVEGRSEKHVASKGQNTRREATTVDW